MSWVLKSLCLMILAVVVSLSPARASEPVTVSQFQFTIAPFIGAPGVGNIHYACSMKASESQLPNTNEGLMDLTAYTMGCDISFGNSAPATVPLSPGGMTVSQALNVFDQVINTVAVPSSTMGQTSCPDGYIRIDLANACMLDLGNLPGPQLCASVKYTFPGFTSGDYVQGINAQGRILNTYENANTMVNMNADIEFHFRDPVPCGRFANGDWWVQGPVTVVRMTPDGVEGRHGYNVDPRVIKAGSNHSLDSRQGLYTPPGALPVTLTPANKAISLLKVNSFMPEHSGSMYCFSEHIGGLSTRPHSNRSCILSAAVLTVLPQAVEDGKYLRPPFVAGDKPLVAAADLDVSKLPRLPQVDGTLAPDYVLEPLKVVTVDHKEDWTARMLHPRMMTQLDYPFRDIADYGMDISNNLAKAMARTLHDDPDPVKRTIAIRVAQIAIDFYHQVKAGQIYAANGGHTAGRKLPILYTGYLLSDTPLGQQMLNVGRDYYEDPNSALLASGERAVKTFSEDDHLFLGQEDRPLFGQTARNAQGQFGGDGVYWSRLNSATCSGAKDARDGSGYFVGGYEYFADPEPSSDPSAYPAALRDYLNKYGVGGVYVDANNPPITHVRVVNHSNGCRGYVTQMPTPEQMIRAGDRRFAPYEFLSLKNYSYQALIVKLLGLENKWNNRRHDAFFAYVDRINKAPWNGAGSYSSAYLNNMFSAYWPGHIRWVPGGPGGHTVDTVPAPRTASSPGSGSGPTPAPQTHGFGAD